MTPAHVPEKIGSVIDSILAERGYLTPVREWGVVNAWANIVGAKLASVTECSRVENGVLYVRVESSAWRQEISYIKRHILDSIRKETPCTTINDIVFY